MADASEESVNEAEEAVETASEAGATEAVEEANIEVENADEAADSTADAEDAVEASDSEDAAAEEEVEEEASEPEPEPEPELPPMDPMSFRGLQKNPGLAITVFLAGVMSFSMGVTNTFFAEATAWTFVVWGVLLLFSNLLDNYQTYELNNDGIAITNPVRFWYPNKKWSWDDIYRLDVLVGRRDTKLEHADMHIYHELTGELIKDREDRKLEPTMAQMIIDRAGLQPVEEANPATIAELKLSQTNKYHWSASGSIA